MDLVFCTCEQGYLRPLRKQLAISPWYTGNGQIRPHFWAFRTFCTTNAVSSGIAADSSDLFLHDDMSDSGALEASGTSLALRFLRSYELAAVVQNYLKQSLTLSFWREEVPRWGRKLGWKPSRPDRSIPRIRCVGNFFRLASRKLVNAFLFFSKTRVHWNVSWLLDEKTQQYATLVRVCRAFKLAISIDNASEDASDDRDAVWFIANTAELECFS